MVNSSGLEKIYTLTDGRMDIQKSDLYSEVALAKNISLEHLKLPKNHFKTNLFFLQLTENMAPTLIKKSKFRILDFLIIGGGGGHIFLFFLNVNEHFRYFSDF